MDRGRMTGREIAVAEAQQAIEERQSRLSAIATSRQAIESQLAPLDTRRSQLHDERRERKAEIAVCERIINSGGSWRPNRQRWQQAQPEQAVLQAREDLSACRTRLAEIEGEKERLWDQVKPLKGQLDRLLDEATTLNREIAAYERVVASEGKRPYQDPATYVSPVPCFG